MPDPAKGEIFAAQLYGCPAAWYTPKDREREKSERDESCAEKSGRGAAAEAAPARREETGPGCQRRVNDMKYQAILFDMDGTLLDTLTDMQAAVNYILEKYGYPTRTLEEVRRFVGNGAGPLIHRALPQGVDPDREAEILADYRAYYQAHNCVETRPYDGIGPLLERLRQAGVRTAVVSNKPDRTTRTLAARFFPELDGAMGQREGIASKPAPDMVRAALARLHAAPEETLYVGDSEVDVATARNAGLDMIGVAWGFRGRAALEAAGAPLVADTPEQLLDMLQ